MFEANIEKIVLVGFLALLFLQGWKVTALQSDLLGIRRKLDSVLQQFDGLKEYLYDIDPQFDDERKLIAELDESLESQVLSFAGMRHVELIKLKTQQGRRTLNTPLCRKS